jgi:hypothetical protein
MTIESSLTPRDNVPNPPEEPAYVIRTDIMGPWFTYPMYPSGAPTLARPARHPWPYIRRK